MSRVLTAKDVCERALRMIGSFPITESAPDGEHLREAMSMLDLLLGETVGTERMFSRIDDTLSMTITNGTQTYDLFTVLGSELPTDRIQFITQAYLEDEDGNRTPVEIVNRQVFEDVPDLAEVGPTTRIYFDRLNTSPTLSIFPTPDADDETEYTLKLVCQRYAPNVAPGGVSGTTVSASVLHDMGQAWQRWMVFQLSHDLGCGAIVKLPESSLGRFKLTADEAKAKLDAFENRQHETTAPVCEPWGM